MASLLPELESVISRKNLRDLVEDMPQLSLIFSPLVATLQPSEPGPAIPPPYRDDFYRARKYMDVMKSQ